VVGAGPVGLTLAIELARRGIACRVVDKRAEPAEEADKAIGVHCRTMEIWEDIGVVREAMDSGLWLHGQTVFVNGRQTHQVDWDLPDLPYAHLGLPQSETERILTARLREHGITVERGVRLRSFHQDDDVVTAQLDGASGDAETVRAAYLVGCDGAHSTVRQGLGLRFEGGMGMFPQLFMLGDVDLDWSMPEGHLLRFIQLDDGEMRGMLVCVPLRGRGRYRVATMAPPRLQAEIGSEVVPDGFSREYAPPGLHDIQAALDRLAPTGTTASNLRWSSIFRIKHGIVDRYRVGRVFVAGDAAHLHPPAGGQGMNTGIQDAWNLGWKLALAVRGLATPGLLDSYDGERRPAGKAVVDRAVRVAFTDEMDMDDEKEQFLTEMQMTLTYAGSPLVGESPGSSDQFGAGPRPGDRAPDVGQLRRVGVGHPLRLFELTRGTAHTLLLYVDATTSEEDILGLEKLGDRLRAEHPELIRSYVVASPEAAVPAPLDLPVVRDTADAFRAAYGVRGAAAFLVRPDGHLGYRCSPISAAALDDHLDTVFRA
jgi:2-polyprenyl-6-methoxyphenol hydroxylase-like FAD-dependent oxidoreductase